MPESPLYVTDGSLDFSGGVNSVKVTTIQSQSNPNGLARNELAWLNNGTVRDGGIYPRGGWRGPLVRIHNGSSTYQGGWMYDKIGADPYLVLQIGGHLYRVTITPNFVVSDLTAAFPGNSPQFNPAGIEQCYMVQGEEFLVVQAGDGTTLPFFWDGTILRRSAGLGGTPKELPAATTMDYYMQRIWYAQNRTYIAGDIVGGPSGTAPYNRSDAILRVTENPIAVGGDGITVPSQAGIIRALRHSANIDVALGQGRLFIFTRKAVYALQVPVTRNDWIAATANNQPLQTVVQLINGSVNDRCIVAVNGDLFYQSFEPGIRSLLQAMRYFNQWGNIQISANEERILQFNDRSLMHGASGIYFQNRLWESQLPIRTVQGIVNQAVAPIDFVPISGFNRQKEPNWEGMYQGLQVFQMFTGDFGGLERAFGVVRAADGGIDLWEFTGDKFECTDGRVTMVIEFPAFTWGKEFELKELIAAEIWADRLFGTVNFELEYREDGQACWRPWHKWKKCSPRSSAENCNNPTAYPLTSCLESYVSTMTMPKPKPDCSDYSARPSTIGYQFQPRLIIKGNVRIRGIILYAEWRGRKLYDKITC